MAVIIFVLKIICDWIKHESSAPNQCIISDDSTVSDQSPKCQRRGNKSEQANHGENIFQLACSNSIFRLVFIALCVIVGGFVPFTSLVHVVHRKYLIRHELLIVLIKKLTFNSRGLHKSFLFLCLRPIAKRNFRNEKIREFFAFDYLFVRRTRSAFFLRTFKNVVLSTSSERDWKNFDDVRSMKICWFRVCEGKQMHLELQTVPECV